MPALTRALSATPLALLGALLLIPSPARAQDDALSLYTSPLGAGGDGEARAGQAQRTPSKVPPRRVPPRGAPSKQAQERNFVLGCFWDVFKPPGDYTLAVNLSAGSSFWETAYSGTNPNLIIRGQVDYRPDPSLPVHLFGVLDHSNYRQEAGPLTYNARNLFLGGGAGAHVWIGPLRLDAGAEIGALNRISTQTDGKNDFSSFAVSPAIGAIGGGALSILGHVALTARAEIRAYPGGRFDGLRTDYAFLYGLEWIIDPKPVQVY